MMNISGLIHSPLNQPSNDPMALFWNIVVFIIDVSFHSRIFNIPRMIPYRSTRNNSIISCLIPSHYSSPLLTHASCMTLSSPALTYLRSHPRHKDATQVIQSDRQADSGYQPGFIDVGNDFSQNRS